MEAEQPEFSISKERLADCEVFSLRGELDMLSAPELTAAIEALDGSARPVAVDLSGLTFLDSHGLHALMSARPGGIPVTLVCPDGNISRLLEIVQAGRTMQVYERLDELFAAQAQRHDAVQDGSA